MLRKLFNFIDYIWPPLKINIVKKKKKKELQPTEEDLDKWAEEFIEKHDKSRRKRRGN